jgi:hypothetical protein
MKVYGPKPPVRSGAPTLGLDHRRHRMHEKHGWTALRLFALVLLAAVLAVTPALGASLIDEEDPPDHSTNYFCVNTDAEHPVGARLAAKFGMAYSEVMRLFCDGGWGFGQIMLALSTGKIAESSPIDLLNQRASGMGWGEIWQEMGLIGRGRFRNENGEAGPPEGLGRPEEKGPPPGLLNRPQLPGNSRGRGRP